MDKERVSEPSSRQSPLTDAEAEFVVWIADRFQALGGCAPHEAQTQALTCHAEWLSMEAVEFGHPDYDWSRDGAADIADDGMSHWGEN